MEISARSGLWQMTTPSMEEAIAKYNRAGARDRLELARRHRETILALFPESAWSDLPLARYALGQPDSENTYCRWLEFRSRELGSISGGAAQKLIIFKRKNAPGWYYPDEFKSLEEAWEALRQNFVDAFALAKKGDWEEIDSLKPLDRGDSFKVKSLHVYYPNDVLPIYGRSALLHFLRVFGQSGDELDGLPRVTLNRILLQAVRAQPELKGWTTNEVGFFLYDAFSPRDARRTVKIAPGENAKYWDDCLRDGYICVGWDDVGDLSEFENKSDFKARFAAVREGRTKSKITAKANELWTLRELEPGDLVVANHGISRILAIGKVEEPGYEWREDRPEYKHTVRVKWDTSFARAIEPQRSWGTVTVANIPQALMQSILSGRHSGGESNSSDDTSAPVDPELSALAETLDRRGQLILYGPPGTGKTYIARRLAVHFLLRKQRNVANTLGDAERFRAAEQSLSAGAGVRDKNREVPLLTRLTFHPSYAYEDFIEGFRPVLGEGQGLILRLEDGVFKRVCLAALANPEQPYVVLIDEINRANLGKVFGEAITVIEKDKRGLSVTLSQSRDAFVVPQNVVIIGTMNTADRSIKLLDAALRRRFAFKELMPDTALLHGARIGALPLEEFLEDLNRKISKAVGREKQIGHSFFLSAGIPIAEPDEFARRFREEILPLLQEYCYDDYASLANYLGDELVNREAGELDEDRIAGTTSLIAALQKELERSQAQSA